jgi:hypothetical protein
MPIIRLKNSTLIKNLILPIKVVMNFLTKIEDFINQLILRFCELSLKLFKRFVPISVINFIKKFRAGLLYLVNNFKTLPATTKVFSIELLKKIKSNLLSINFKEKLIASYIVVQNYYKKQSSKGPGKFKASIVTPIHLMAKWLQGLSIAQSMLLLGFSVASFLAGVSIISSGGRMISKNSALRNPASIGEEFEYERPEYYKKDIRHLLITSVRLPVYIGGLNDLKSVDIDFNVTLSNRQSKLTLAKLELQLRDHLILHIEPLIASFPLKEEGREILKKKIWLEIDEFLKSRDAQGHVIELEVTYLLAN